MRYSGLGSTGVWVANVQATPRAALAKKTCFTNEGYSYVGGLFPFHKERLEHTSWLPPGCTLECLCELVSLCAFHRRGVRAKHPDALDSIRYRVHFLLSSFLFPLKAPVSYKKIDVVGEGWWKRSMRGCIERCLCCCLPLLPLILWAGRLVTENSD
jgi:hypothetical protein